MNRYGRLAREFSRRHRPRAFAKTRDPDRFFTAVGDEIQAEVTRRRDELLGGPRPGENPEAYRRRSYQALATAQEPTLADHPLFEPEPETGAQETDNDPDLDRYRRLLNEINRAIHDNP